MTKVSYAVTRTINLGNYESVKVQAGLELSLQDNLPHTIQSGYEFAKQFVDKRIEEETDKWNE